MEFKMKILKLVLAGLLLLWVPVVAQAQFTFETNNGAITITGYTSTNTVVVIPDMTNGFPVTSIAGWAFSSTNIVSVTIPDSVNTIGNGAFCGCVHLTSLTLPGSITNIGVGAFSSCLSLTNVTIPASVTSIGDYTFFYCTNLTAIVVDAANPAYSSADGVLFNKDKTILMQFPFGKGGSYSIPGSVTSIADEAFGMNDHGHYSFSYSACAGLTNLVIPGSVTNLDDSAFSHCTGLISIALGNGVASIGTNAFSWCSNLTSITIPSSVTNLDQLAFYYSGLTQVTIPGSVTHFGVGAFAVCSSLTNVTMLDGVTSIGKAGFNFCTNLTSIAIPDSLTSIGERAFFFCTGLTNVTIPRNVASIGDFAFSECTSLININVSADNTFYKSVNGVLFNGDQTTLIQFPGGRGGSCRVPSGVTSIGDYAFAYIPADLQFALILGYPLSCASLTNIIIPATVTTIGDGAFGGLYNLTSVYFEGDAPAGVGGLYGNVTIYYLPETTGWDLTFGNPKLWWLPTMQNAATSLGGQTNQFGFNIQWASDKTVVVEACTNFSNPDWQPVQTNLLTGGSAYFTDLQWTNYPSRFYRLRSP